MATKFILHGGFNPSQSDEDNTDFYREILKDAPQNAKVLSVPFAKDLDRVQISTERITKELNNVKQEKNITIEVATEERFIEQVQSSDVVYFHGGVSQKLLDILKNYPNLKEFLTGKTIAGESAGANVLATYFYSPKTDRVSEGLGILPLKVIPHFKKEYESKLDGVGEDLEVLCLPEYQFRVFQF